MPTGWTIRLTKEEKKKLEAKIVQVRKEDKLPYSLLAERFGVSEYYIYSVLKRNGFSMLKRGRPKGKLSWF